MDNFGGDAAREEEEDPADRCWGLAGDVSAEVGSLGPSIFRGDVEICARAGNGVVGVRGADVGDSETAGTAETRGGVEALVVDVDTAVGGVES